MLDRLTEIALLTGSHEAVLSRLGHEQFRLRSELAGTGYKPGEHAQRELLS